MRRRRRSTATRRTAPATANTARLTGSRSPRRAMDDAHRARPAARELAVQRSRGGLPGLSRSLLTKRLRRMEHAGLVDRLDGQYHLTEAGAALRPIVFGLGEWAAHYIFGDPQPLELDAELLVWWMHQRIDTQLLPDRRTVLHVRFDDDPAATGSSSTHKGRRSATSTPASTSTSRSEPTSTPSTGCGSAANR